MSKFQALSILAASICLLSFLGIASGHDYLIAEGQVYCDTCKIGFLTRVSEWIEGAGVRLECRNSTTTKIKMGVEGVTNSTGWYQIPVEGDHEDEICDVTIIKSPRPDCDGSTGRRDSSRVLLTKNVGVASDFRLINPLGFEIKTPIPSCVEVLKELELFEI